MATGRSPRARRRPGSTRPAGMRARPSGDVNGDGRPDLFVASYTDPNALVQSPAGFPTNHLAVRDLLYLNEGTDANGYSIFRDVARAVGVERSKVGHGLGAVFTDYDGDGRLDLYVANDADPNQLYRNVDDRGNLGFRLAGGGAAVRTSPIRMPAWGSPQPTSTVTGAPTCSSPTHVASCTPRTEAEERTGSRRSPTPAPSSPRRSAPTRRAGATPGRISTSTATSTSCSRTAPSRSRASRRTLSTSRSSRTSRRRAAPIASRRSGARRAGPGPRVNGRGLGDSRLRQRRRPGRGGQLDRRPADPPPQRRACAGTGSR